jgi:uncharacterized protein (DUF2141 family)
MSHALLTGLLLILLQFPVLNADSPLRSVTGSQAILEITFTGIRNGEGQIAAGVNHSPEGWPHKPHMDPKWKKTNGGSSSLTVRLENLDYGTYAISMLDDENSNNKMDNFLGVPREGFGFSNNPKVGLSAPSFEECAFVIDEPLEKITIKVNYMRK